MRVGLTLDFRNPPQYRRPWREMWEDCLYLMTEAEQLGFDALYIQEHFFTDDGYGPSVPVFLAVLAERTSVVRLGSWIYILPLHNAVQVAQETAVLDHLSEGRLDVGMAVGHRLAEFRAFGVSEKTRPSRFVEGVEVLKKAWTERPFSYHGKYHNLDNVEVRPEPQQQPHPPIWIGATTPTAAERAGRLGANFHGGSTDPTAFEAYRRGLQSSGHDPQDFRVSLGMSVTTTTEDPEAVWRRNQPFYHYRWDFYRVIREEFGDPQLSVKTVDAQPDAQAYRENELIADPDTITSTLRSLHDNLGLTDLVIYGPHAGSDLRGEGLESLKLFAKEVLPVVHGWERG